ncbi:MAG: NB-ARC domain-containing protein, partial [candidate division KSB1 bacterium]
MREWIDALNGVISENAPTLDELKNNLNKLLEGRQCLLVVDDVWRKAHAEAFRVGSQSRLLLTTRDAEVAAELGAMVQHVPLMAREEAVRLLEEWAEGNLSEIDFALKERIVERLGRLPLALRLAGAQLRNREPETWLASFEVHQLKAKRIEGMHDSLAKTFALSLEALGETRPLYTALAIFKEDEAIPETALHKLWSGLANFDAAQTAELLEDLASRALLTLENKTTPRRASLHDLLRDLIASELNNETRRHAHTCLLQAYRTTCSGSGWHTAPDDGYLYDHLVYHLENTQQWDELYALFKDQNWMHARVPQCDYDYNGYLSDLMVAWQEAHKRAQAQIAAQEMPTTLADCVRYALIGTSVNSLAANYVPALVARAVETGLWSAQRALSLAAKVPRPEQRAQFFVMLLSSARIDHESRAFAQREGLATTRAIIGERSRALVLAALAPQLTGENLRECLATARAILNVWSRAQVLAALAPQLTGEEREQVLREGLSAARAIEVERYRAQVLVALAPQLTGENLHEGLASARAIIGERSRALVLAALVPQLTGENLHECLATAPAILNVWSRAQVLAALAPQLTG